MITKSFFTRYSLPITLAVVTAAAIVGAVFLGEIFVIAALATGFFALFSAALQAKSDIDDIVHDSIDILSNEHALFKRTIDNACDKVHEKQLSLDEWKETKTNAVKNFAETIKVALAEFKFYQTINTILSTLFFFLTSKPSETDELPVETQQVMHLLENAADKVIDGQSTGNPVELKDIEGYMTKKENYKRVYDARHSFFGTATTLTEEHEAKTAMEEAFVQLCKF